MGVNNCSDTYNLKIMCIFQKSNIIKVVITPLNYDQYFLLKLAPLDSAHTELSIHAKNSIILSGPFSQSGSHNIIISIEAVCTVLHINFHLFINVSKSQLS